MGKVLHTKWGNANIDTDGYYRITSKKEGNHNKLLHRLIWEDFYNTEVPKGYVIHHRNGDKLCNCILNLQLMRWGEHTYLHIHHNGNYGEKNPFYGKQHSLDSLVKMSKGHNNTSGYLRVTKRECNTCKQGFRWEYKYVENGKRKAISSTTIDKLEEKVKSKGLEWKKI